jgi:mannan endo-1,4-beta-mannosidase
VVDIVGYDKYNAVDGLPNLSSISSTFYSLVKSTDGKKMVTMSENDSIPSLENLLNDKAGWLYFCPWYMNYLTSKQNNPVDNLIEIYNSEYCITLDELPDLKSYPMADETEVIRGDVNLDGSVDSADIVLLAKYLTVKTNLNARQSEAAMLTDDNRLDAFDLVALRRTVLNKN